MATNRQTEANRLNALASTGPKTEEGKERSRRNALKHGLTGDGVVLPEQDAALLDRRLAAWQPDYVIETDQQKFLFHRLILCSVRLDRCTSDERAIRTRQAERARTCWDDDRQLDIERIAIALPRKPSLVSRQLVTSKHGCHWMIERWRMLGLAAECGQNWDEAQVSLALDMLGAPRELRNLVELVPNESRKAMADREIARLQDRLDNGLDDLDAQERDLAEIGQELTLSPELRRIRRYEDACVREFYKVRALLLQSQPATFTAPAEPRPATAPVAPPPPPPPPAPEPERPIASFPRADEEDYRARTVEQLCQLFTAGLDAQPADDRDAATAGAPMFDSVDSFRKAMSDLVGFRNRL